MGRCIVAGGKPDMAAPFAGILASDLAVGSIVKLMENGTAVEYLVVNKGKPSGSTLYDDSCDGLWLLRKDIHSKVDRDRTTCDYPSSNPHAFVNNDFFNTLGSIEQSVVKTVKIPTANGSGVVSSGANGTQCRAFIPSAFEVGSWTSAKYVDGALCSYFGTDLSAGSADSLKRIAYLNGVATEWYTRTVSIPPNICGVTETGTSVNGGITMAGVRPMLILPHTAIFDEETLILKGVA